MYWWNWKKSLSISSISCSVESQVLPAEACEVPLKAATSFPFFFPHYVIGFNWPSLEITNTRSRFAPTAHMDFIRWGAVVGASWLSFLKKRLTSCTGWGHRDRRKSPLPSLRSNPLLLSPARRSPPLPKTLLKLIASDINMQLPQWYVVWEVKLCTSIT